MNHNIFIAYSTRELGSTLSTARRLWKVLKGCGFSLWSDLQLTYDVEDRNTHIIEAIRSCDVFLLVLTTQPALSSDCQYEYYLAQQYGKSIITVSLCSIAPTALPSSTSNTVIDLSLHFEQGITDLHYQLKRLNLLTHEPVTTGSVEMTSSLDRIRKMISAENKKQKARSQPLSPVGSAKLLGKFIQQSLVDIGLNEQAFIDKLGLDAEYVAGILNGDYLPHHIDNAALVAIAQGIGYDPDTLRTLLGLPSELSPVDKDAEPPQDQPTNHAPVRLPGGPSVFTKSALHKDRIHLIYEIASRIGSTLDDNRILDAALEIGKLALRDSDLHSTLVSAVLVRQHNQLSVAATSYLARQDEQLTIPGRQGIFSRALQQIPPIFTPYLDDPELRYFESFRQAQSLLIVPLRDGSDVYGLLVVGSAQPHAFLEQYAELLTVLGNHVALALRNAELYHQLRATSNFSTIATQINGARRQLRSKPQEADAALQKVEKTAQQTTQDIHRLLIAHKPFGIESQGLGELLRDLAVRMKESQDFTVEMEIQPDIEYQLDDMRKGAFFSITEEVVAHARKHAHATHVKINLFTRQSYVILSIQDNGVGFDAESINSIYDQHGDSGLFNLRQRVELINGLLHIWNMDRDSKSGQGTKISVVVPIEDQSLRKAPATLNAEERSLRNALATLTARLNSEYQHPNDEQSDLDYVGI